MINIMSINSIVKITILLLLIVFVIYSLKKYNDMYNLINDTKLKVQCVEKNINVDLLDKLKIFNNSLISKINRVNFMNEMDNIQPSNNCCTDSEIDSNACINSCAVIGNEKLFCTLSNNIEDVLIPIELDNKSSSPSIQLDEIITLHRNPELIENANSIDEIKVNKDVNNVNNNLQNYKRHELMKIAKERGYTISNKMTKDELLKLLFV